jgi:hypothetical protein
MIAWSGGRSSHRAIGGIGVSNQDVDEGSGGVPDTTQGAVGLEAMTDLIDLRVRLYASDAHKRRVAQRTVLPKRRDHPVGIGHSGHWTLARPMLTSR